LPKSAWERALAGGRIKRGKYSKTHIVIFNRPEERQPKKKSQENISKNDLSSWSPLSDAGGGSHQDTTKGVKVQAEQQGENVISGEGRNEKYKQGKRQQPSRGTDQGYEGDARTRQR